VFDRTGRSILVFWLIFWTGGWILQILTLHSTTSETSDPSSRPGTIFIETRWFIRVLFGLVPRDGTLKLQAAIMQGLALLMAVIEILIRHFVGVQNVLGFTTILLTIYLIILLFLGYFLLDRIYK